MIALDVESLGLDLKHSAKPFMLTLCNDDLEVTNYTWEVDPVTREPKIPREDVEEIKTLLEVLGGWGKDFSSDIAEHHTLITQNGKFDAMALRSIGIDNWPWHQMRDTLIAGHVLASNRPHGLDEMSVQYLGKNISKYEKDTEEATKHCRNLVRQVKNRLDIEVRGTEKKRGKKADRLPLTPQQQKELIHLKSLPENELSNWVIADSGVEGMPSATEKTWKHDLWLPRAYVKHMWESSKAGKYWINCPKGEEQKRWKQLPNMEGFEFHHPEIDEDSAHPYWSVTSKYANADSSVTMMLWRVMHEELHQRKLWGYFAHNMKIIPILHEMEWEGVTGNVTNTTKLKKRIKKEADQSKKMCEVVATSKGYKLLLPGTGNSKSLINFCFGPPLQVGEKVTGKVVKKTKPIFDNYKRVKDPTCLNLIPLSRSDKTGQPALTKLTMEEYCLTLPRNSKELVFCKNLSKLRRREKALSAIKSYEKFRVVDIGCPGFFRLYATINPTGTDTTRFSSERPNTQQKAKKMEPCPHCHQTGEVNGKECKPCKGEGEISFNLREGFGPLPGEEWWSLDAKNIELRIPAYLSGEKELISLFEKGNEPPYYGSNHLLNFHTVYPEIWEREEKLVGFDKVGPHCKKKYASGEYTDCKNGGLGMQYGAGRKKANATFKRSFAYDRMVGKFVKLLGPGGLNDRCIEEGERLGYVETIPDVTVDPLRGYPLLVKRTEYGGVLSTTPLNYKVQGSAGWWMRKAMVRCQEQILGWRKEGFNSRIVLTVHDELVFSMPRSLTHPREDFEKEKQGRHPVMIGSSNLWRVRILQKLMEEGGKDLGNIPTPVNVELHEENWGHGETF